MGTRELEQLLQSHQQKGLLAASASEERWKRHSAKVKKVGQAVEEGAKRLGAMEEAISRRPGRWLEARMLELEEQLMELHSVVVLVDALANNSTGQVPRE